MQTLKQGNEVKPSVGGPHWVDPTYRPPFSYPHRLSTGETWQSLAKRYQRPVQSLLLENFRTTDPYEINWYLREYVKCDLATADRYNWRFSTSSQSGGGPRAGIIFIIPNWSSIGTAARAATKSLVNEWWRNARFSGSINGKALSYRTGAISTSGVGSAFFEMALREAGAPDPLSKQWTTTLVDSLGFFANALNGTHPEAFPGWASVAPGSHLPPTPAASWLVLQAGGANYGLFGPAPMRVISRGFPFDGPGANKTLTDYGQWLERAMQDLSNRLHATGVWGMPTVLPNGSVTGHAVGRGSCYSEAALTD